jgi:2-phosphosulfolactate phosphatase
MHADCYIVVDTLRATTTIATLFSLGVNELWVASSIEAARGLAAEHDALLLGEVGGLPPQGFAFGNSPTELSAASLPSRAVLFTTNGTGALCALASSGRPTFAGALVNASAIARTAQTYQHVAMVCAGESGGKSFALEDYAVAAVLAGKLREFRPDGTLNDAALLALELDAAAAPRLIAAAHHAEALRRLGLEADIAFASKTDTVTTVPMVTACGDDWALLTSVATAPGGGALA